MIFDLAAETKALGIELAPEALGQLRAYRDLLAEASRHFNLTSIRDPEGIEKRHLLESLALGQELQQRRLLTTGSRVIDIGTGAGLPGLPIKIALPGCHIALLESLGKRCAFLRQAIAELGLEGIEVLQGRAEELAREPALRESFDLVLARAVAPLAVLLEYSLPFLRPGGYLAATKGSAAPTEIASANRALTELQGEIVDVAPFEPPHVLPQSLLIVRKTGATPSRYPRRAGIPAKRPIA